MAKKIKTRYECQKCRESFPKWQGQCPACGEWNCLEEVTPDQADQKKTPGPASRQRARNFEESPGAWLSPAINPGEKPDLKLVTPISQAEAVEMPRLRCGLTGFDELVGGGLVPGALYLVGGEPGIGKSTLILEIARQFSGKVFYFSGEESVEQIRMRAARTGVLADHLYVMAEANAAAIMEILEQTRPALVFIDSIQTMFHPGLKQAPGSVTQVREVTLFFLEYAKTTNTPVFLTGHITKEGQIAGPKVLEHIVDTVLYFEGDKWNYHRLLRVMKNRFGPVGELSVWEMKHNGLKEVRNPGGIFIEQASLSRPGSAIGIALEGSRALALEVQALAVAAHFANNRRMADGLDSKRMTLLVAVLEKHGRLPLGERDLFFKITGGISSADPGLDLALAAATISSLLDIPVPESSVFLGEVGLQGEIRTIRQGDARIKEARQLGIRQVFLPPGNRKDIPSDQGLECRTVATVGDLLKFFPGAPDMLARGPRREKPRGNITSLTNPS